MERDSKVFLGENTEHVLQQIQKDLDEHQRKKLV